MMSRVARPPAPRRPSENRFFPPHFVGLAGGLLCVLACVRVAAADAGILRNADFGARAALQDWELTVYGASPEVRLDDAVRHGRAHSLCVTAAKPTDTALGQEATLTPNRWYCFSGWVKTRELEPRDATVFGTLQVQNPAGRGLIAAGVNHRGDTDWTAVPVYFQAPSDGRVRVCLFFAGFGKGTGTAWFDDLKLEETDLSRCPIRVTAEPAVPARISPLQYGQFIEYLCNLVPGMWAEKLYDGSFEGLSAYKFQFLPETDFREKPWYPSGEVNRAEYSLDHATKVSGEVSKRIAVADGAPCTVGLSQDGIFVERGVPCQFQCWFRSERLRGPVRVRVHQGRRVYASAEFRPGTAWGKFAARLVPNVRDVNATLTIEFRGPGTLWLDDASLMPADTIGGWRREVVDAVRALHPGIIRFGGSTLDDPNLGDFEWRDTIGDPDRRRPFRAWGGLQPVGPGLEEIVQFCRAVNAEPLICVRFSRRAPSDAADEVEYFNGASDTPMGAWRARNGHPEPYRVRYWQVGNERAGRQYEERLPAFCAAMKAVDPGIQLLSSFPTPGVLRQAGAYLDYVCPHHYSHDLGWMENNIEVVEQMIRENAPGRVIKIAVTEWNTTAGDAGPRRAMLWTLANALACSRYHNLLHRHCDLVEIANRSNLINSFCSGILQTDNHRLYKTPTYYAQQLYATLAGSRPLKIESGIPSNVGPDLSATLSADGREVTLFAINDTLDDILRPLDLSAFGRGARPVSVWTLADRDHAGEPDATNSFDEPERVAPVRSRVRWTGSGQAYRFPALSLTVLRWQTR